MKTLFLAAALALLASPSFAAESVRGTCNLGIGDGTPDAVSPCLFMEAQSGGLTGLAFDYDLDSAGPMVLYGYYAERRTRFVVTHINPDINSPSEKALPVSGSCTVDPYPSCRVNLAGKVVTIGLLARE